MKALWGGMLETRSGGWNKIPVPEIQIAVHSISGQYSICSKLQKPVISNHFCVFRVESDVSVRKHKSFFVQLNSKREVL